MLNCRCKCKCKFKWKCKYKVTIMINYFGIFNFTIFPCKYEVIQFTPFLAWFYLITNYDSLTVLLLQKMFLMQHTELLMWIEFFFFTHMLLTWLSFKVEMEVKICRGNNWICICNNMYAVWAKLPSIFYFFNIFIHGFKNNI